ncbi:MAG TPA: F0F1 ATP synthase subunit A [Terriglobales bacterium]|nr:F0F1 ATP synthase subunit A [Terriglobales bacterium]
MPEQLWFTALLNKVLGGPVTALLEKLPAKFHPVNPTAPISNAVAMEFLVIVLLVLFFLWVRSRLSVDKPGASQHLMEALNEFISKQGEEIIGHGGARFVPYLTSVFIFILFANLIGLIPTLESPTSFAYVPLGLAVVTFIYYNVHGVREQGVLGYLKHFMGPVWWLAWLLFPIEIISHFARIMSLTIRLYANIFAGDMVTMTFFILIPIGVPVIFLLLHVAVSFLQAYIFTLLTTIYLQGAVAHEH